MLQFFQTALDLQQQLGVFLLNLLHSLLLDCELPLEVVALDLQHALGCPGLDYCGFQFGYFRFEKVHLLGGLA